MDIYEKFFEPLGCILGCIFIIAVIGFIVCISIYGLFFWYKELLLLI